MPPSLASKLEGDGLVRNCEEEIKALHKIFVTWFRGEETLESLQQDLHLRMVPQFSHVAPNGHMVVGRDTLINYLVDKYACYQDRVFSIDVYNVKLLWSSPTHCLASYEEWQSWDDDDEKQQFGRLSTCLLERSRTNYKWIHVHETWMEAEEPKIQEPLSKVSLTVDEETVMTGPVPPEDIQKKYPVSNNLLDSHSSHNDGSSNTGLYLHREEEEDGDDDKRQFLVLIHSKTINETQAEHQKLAQSILAENEHVLIDGATKNSDYDINDLLRISAEAGITQYPQFFVAQGPEVSFWGSWDDFFACHSNDNLASDLKEDVAPKYEEQTKQRVEEGEPEMTSEERQFMEASQGILVFEEEGADTVTPAPVPTAQGSDGGLLDDLMQGGTGDGSDDEDHSASFQQPTSTGKDEDQASQAMLSLNSASGASHKRHVSPKLDKYAKPLMWDNNLVGVTVAGFDIGTSQGSMADSNWYADKEHSLEKLAGNRKIVLPEMVFPVAHVAMEGHGIWMSWDATDCLSAWASAHKHITVGSDDAYKGVSVLKAKDASLWEKRRKNKSKASGPFHYDWTFSTPFAVKMEGGTWLELDESGMRMDLLTDKSVPILFFDEIVLYEDDLHDNGQVQMSIKLRIMPSCAYILARLWVRVDQVLVRVHETRVLVDFFGITPTVYRDISWRECAWEDLPQYGLPNSVRAWSCEQGETPAWNNLVQNIPEIELPEGMIRHSVLEYNKSAPKKDRTEV